MDIPGHAQAVSALFLVLTPDLTIVDASDAFLCANLAWRDDIRGRDFFETFPANPGGGSNAGLSDLRTSIDRVIDRGVPDRMPMQRYDMRDHVAKPGAWAEKFWLRLNSPLFGNDDSTVTHLLLEVDDVSEEMTLRRSLFEQSGALAEQMASLASLRRDPARRDAGEQSLVAGGNWNLTLMRRELDEREDELREARKPLDSVLDGSVPRAELSEVLRRKLDGESRYFSAGDRAPAAATYAQYHAAGCQRRKRPIFLREGYELPVCRQCLGAVRYRLTRAGGV